MELLNTLFNLMGLGFCFGTIVSMGLSLTMKQITGPLRVSGAFCRHFVLDQANLETKTHGK